MTRQSQVPLERRNLSTSARTAREIARFYLDGQIDVDQPYQRGEVWTVDQQIGLVKSWLENIPVPAVILNDRFAAAWAKTNGFPSEDEPIYAAIDGKQRILTAAAWFGGDLAVPASWFAPEDVETTVNTDDGFYVAYSGLTRSAQLRMSNGAQLPVAIGQLSTVADEAEVYLLVNGAGTAQTETDMARAAAVAGERDESSPWPSKPAITSLDELAIDDLTEDEAKRFLTALGQVVDDVEVPGRAAPAADGDGDRRR